MKGLKRAMKDCSHIKESEKKALEELQDRGRAIFAPEKGGSYEAWKTRPMNLDLIQYAAADVRHLHAMKVSDLKTHTFKQTLIVHGFR